MNRDSDKRTFDPEGVEFQIPIHLFTFSPFRAVKIGILIGQRQSENGVKTTKWFNLNRDSDKRTFGPEGVEFQIPIHLFTFSPFGATFKTKIYSVHSFSPRFQPWA